MAAGDTEWGFLDGYHGSVQIVPSMMPEPTPGLLTNTYTSAQQLLAELNAAEAAWLLDTEPMAGFSDAERERYARRYAPLLGMRRRYMNSAHTKELADWLDELAGCCTEVERGHAEMFEFGGQRLHAVLVHMGPGLAAYVLLYEAGGVTLGLRSVIGMLSEERLGAMPAEAEPASLPRMDI